MPDIINIAHRGASSLETENSFAAFEKAIEMGADMLEMDAHATADGEIVVHHDDTLKGGRKNARIDGMLLMEIKKIKLKNGQEIPMLREVLERFRGRCQFNVEIKSRDAALPALGIVRELDMLEDVLFSSFHGPWLLTIRSKDKKARLAIISRDRSINMVQIALSLGAEAIHPERRLLNRELLENAWLENLRVNVWTVNRASSMKKYVEMGVDGIITDKPDTLSKILGGY